MQIQPISNNYQVRTQKAQKQNNPSFGAHILFAKPKEISALEQRIEDMAVHANRTTTRNFLIGIRNFLVETLRNLKKHCNTYS